jgi:hypothetical protein
MIHPVMARAGGPATTFLRAIGKVVGLPHVTRLCLGAA